MKTIRQFFFFFILGAGTHRASHGISGDPVLVRMRVVRLLLQAVTSECLRKRGKKERGRESEGGREWMRGGRGRLLLLPFEKTEKLLRALSQEGFGSGGAAGEPCSCVPHSQLGAAQPSPHSTQSIQRQSSPWACTKPCSHTPRARAPLSAPPPPPLLFLLCSFSPEKKTLSCALSSDFWISLWTSRG